MEQCIREIIQDSDMVLVGIGEEFEGVRQLKQITEYVRLIEEAEASGKEWMIPALNRYFADREIKKGKSAFVQIPNALSNLAKLLQDKNYFVVTVTTNDYVWDAGERNSVLVGKIVKCTLNRLVRKNGNSYKEIFATGFMKMRPVLNVKVHWF